MKKAPFFICDNHENALEEMDEKNKLFKQKLKEEDINEDEGDWIEDSHLIKPGFSHAKRKESPVLSPDKKIKKSKLQSTKRSPLGEKSEKSPADKRTSFPSSSPLQKIRSIRAKITEEILIDDSTSDSEDDNDSPTSGSGHGKSQAKNPTDTGSSIVTVPFQLFNPQTKEYNVMKVAPMQYCELAPNLEGLNLQIHEALQKYSQKQPAAGSSMAGNGNEEQLLPQICQTMSLATPQNDIIDLCDSD